MFKMTTADVITPALLNEEQLTLGLIVSETQKDDIIDCNAFDELDFDPFAGLKLN